MKVLPLLPHPHFPSVVAKSQEKQKALRVLSVATLASLQQKMGQETEHIWKGFPSQYYEL